MFDVTDSQAFDREVDNVIERHGRLDVMINNAGIAPPPDSARFERAVANQLLRMQGRIAEMEPLDGLVNLTDDRFDRMIRTHLYGVFYGTRAALRHMTPQRSGSIINISSILGIQPAGGPPDYAAAKAGIIALTKSAAGEVAHLGIRVNAVCPGYIDTPLLKPFDAEVRERDDDADRDGPDGHGRRDRRARSVPGRTREQLLDGRRLRRQRGVPMTTIFTRIIAGEIPGTFVWRDDRCVAFLSVNPMAHGHTLVVPIEEVDHWIDASPDLTAHLFSVVREIGVAQHAAFACERVGVIVAGYEVPHCHIHVIPTNAMAELSFANAAASVERDELDSAAEAIRAELRRLGHTAVVE